MSSGCLRQGAASMVPVDTPADGESSSFPVTLPEKNTFVHFDEAPNAELQGPPTASAPPVLLERFFETRPNVDTEDREEQEPQANVFATMSPTSLSALIGTNASNYRSERFGERLETRPTLDAEDREEQEPQANVFATMSPTSLSALIGNNGSSCRSEPFGDLRGAGLGDGNPATLVLAAAPVVAPVATQHRPVPLALSTLGGVSSTEHAPLAPPSLPGLASMTEASLLSVQLPPPPPQSPLADRGSPLPPPPPRSPTLASAQPRDVVGTALMAGDSPWPPMPPPPRSPTTATSVAPVAVSPLWVQPMQEFLTTVPSSAAVPAAEPPKPPRSPPPETKEPHSSDKQAAAVAAATAAAAVVPWRWPRPHGACASWGYHC
mmetsp:Transcript_25238/g.63694  ORF Transcript_25238/g.63694 Transcript_25238/m.63694 type:complete len:378 (-) Transcript_25238:53-1186(-)